MVQYTKHAIQERREIDLPASSTNRWRNTSDLIKAGEKAAQLISCIAENEMLQHQLNVPGKQK